MPKKRTKAKYRVTTLPGTSPRDWHDACEGCTLCRKNNLAGTVGTEHHAPAGKVEVMFIAEAPGEHRGA